MRPADSPDFFRRPPPPGRSRESSIRLDENGRFWHDGRPVEHAGVARSFARWIDRHPLDGRYILNNGYDWTYLTVDGAPLFVVGVRAGERGLLLRLSDGSDELLDADRLWIGSRDAVYADVRAGTWLARFTPAAQLALEPFLVEGPGGEPELRVGARTSRFAPLSERD